MSDGQNGTDKPKRKYTAANYALECRLDIGSAEVQEALKGLDIWVQLKAGFTSAKTALDYPEKQKIEGVFRAVRIASDLYDAALTTPEPVFTIKKRADATKTPRKTRQKKTAPTTPCPTSNMEPPVEDVPPAIPPDGDQDGTPA